MDSRVPTLFSRLNPDARKSSSLKFENDRFQELHAGGYLHPQETLCSFTFAVKHFFFASSFHMSLPLAAYIVITIAVAAGSLGLAAFLWAIRTKQFSIEHLNKGAAIIFDDDEPIGRPQDHLFKSGHGNAEASNP